MAFTRATGKHRKPSRAVRVSANAAGIATLAATGVVAGFAAPALAATTDDVHRSTEDTGLTQAVVIGEDTAGRIGEQAQVQSSAAAESTAVHDAETAAKQQAADVKKADDEAKRKAEAERKEQERVAREQERKRLNTFVSPIAGSYVSTSYKASSGLWSSGSHTGVDFHAETGTSVQAVGAGTIVEAGWGGAYGNNVVIKHNDGTYTQYGHLSSIDVSVGQSVTAGQQIGLSGATGNVTGPHLHFEARTGAVYGTDIDPVAYLSEHGVSL
ncbi:peptidoglycan DD-metalloendopeptidase family protein [Streptomyces sp. NRRL B-1677]|uniref:M23 family peptidase n=1 Tax=Streptomyces klenkii TaxID=1420899 RepID=A0A3B0BKM2_9ACTN|nr:MULTISPECIES: peptidoglycan DD-metalloendopeptidase family protein [Streptomyces]MBF6045409.1 peptidoglycan DD-metalloendopeptidase family protein [Streptomyces sp. NRRL B-1677]RKN72818.1 M23 family peptidase [Streptomyces klenkii]